MTVVRLSPASFVGFRRVPVRLLGRLQRGARSVADGRIRDQNPTSVHLGFRIAASDRSRSMTYSAVAALGTLLALAARAEQPAALTLEQALAEAAARNARLPVAESDLVAAQEQVRSARGARLPRLSVESAFQVSLPGFGYGSGGASSIAGEERLQLVGR